MISFLINAIKIVFILGFLVFIHEGGHFIIANLCKVKVNEFAIGFGPTIWSKQGKETKYALRLIPLGGFVSMEGEEERSEEGGSPPHVFLPLHIPPLSFQRLLSLSNPCCRFSRSARRGPAQTCPFARGAVYWRVLTFEYF